MKTLFATLLVAGAVVSAPANAGTWGLLGDILRAGNAAEYHGGRVGDGNMNPTVAFSSARSAALDNGATKAEANRAGQRAASSAQTFGH